MASIRCWFTSGLILIIALLVTLLLMEERVKKMEQMEEKLKQMEEKVKQMEEMEENVKQMEDKAKQMEKENEALKIKLKDPVTANAVAHQAFQDAERWRKEIVDNLYANMTDLDWDTAARWKRFTEPNEKWRECASVELTQSSLCNFEFIETGRLRMLNSEKVWDKESIKKALALYAYHSTGLEGNTLTLPETLIIIDGKTLFGGFPDDQASPSIGPSVTEIRNLQQVMESLELPIPFKLTKLNSHKFQPITERYIIDVNAAITRDLGVPQNLRTKPAAVGFQKVLLPMPDELPVLLTEYVNWLSTTLDKIAWDPAETNMTALKEVINLSCDAHTKLVHIHPFADGNGRLARIISSVILQHFGLPGALIKKEDRLKYMKAVGSAINDRSYSALCNMNFQSICDAINTFLN